MTNDLNLPSGWTYEYVPTLGCNCLFYKSRLIYKDISAVATTNDLIKFCNSFNFERQDQKTVDSSKF